MQDQRLGKRPFRRAVAVRPLPEWQVAHPADGPHGGGRVLAAACECEEELHLEASEAGVARRGALGVVGGSLWRPRGAVGVVIRSGRIRKRDV